MAGFFIHTSNRLEELARVLAAFLVEKKSVGVLEPEVVVVPSRGLERWLKLYLAQNSGVSANLEFPFPQAFLNQAVFADLRRRIDPTLTVNPFAQEVLAWKIFFALERGGGQGLGLVPELDTYLSKTGDELSRFHLAFALADLFDRYLLSRPELIRAWERGDNPLNQFAASRWQKELWQSLSRGEASVHFAALHELANQMIYPEYFPEPAPFPLEELSSALPSRLFLFGFAALPFTYFDLFKGLSRLTEVHLFHCNPCAEYWGDQYQTGGGKRRAKMVSKDSGESLDATVGHPLLASWGRLGRAFFDLAATLEVDQYNEYFVPPEENSLLAHLQRQILFLDPPASPVNLNEGDHSLQIHRCHGRRREIEILYDNILLALDRDLGLEPDDILVMAPDIALYEPYIEALFAHRRPLSGRPRLPVSLVSSNSALKLPVIRALFDLLRLTRSRYRLSEVFDLFSQDVVCRRFSVSESGLEMLADWLQKAGVNWGLDRDFRQETVGVGFSEHSFAWGLDRLLAGYGLSGNSLSGRGAGDSGAAATEIWPQGESDFMPLPGIEGSEALILGSFSAFMAELNAARQRLGKALPASRWRVELKRLLDDFILPQTADDGGLSLLQQALETFAQELENGSGGFSDANEPDANQPNENENGYLSTETIIAALEKGLAESRGSAGFYAGGITFSSILPLRALPAKMICLLGLNDGEFPRNQRPPSYDLIAAVPRAGDRTARDEDCYLFLETLLAARKTFVLSYLGRDPQDNHLRPPSVVVSELLDYVEECFAPPTEAKSLSIRDFILYDHPPQSFSSRYFSSSKNSEAGAKSLFSYDRVEAEIAADLSRREKSEPDFLAETLPQVLPESVELFELIHFYTNPARYFLQKRLHIIPEIRDIDRFDDSEPFALDALDSYQLYDEMIAWLMDQSEIERSDPATIVKLEKRLAAAGKLPPLSPGRVVFADKVKTAITMTTLLHSFCQQALPSLQESLSLSIDGHAIEIGIKVAGLYGGADGVTRQILYRPGSKVTEKDRTKSTILHLGLELAGAVSNVVADFVDGDFSPATETRFQALTEKEQLVLPVRGAAAARIELELLLTIFLEGLRRPLPFLPALSLPWYKTWIKEQEKGGDESGRSAARAKVRSLMVGEYNYDAKDEAFQFCFRDRLEDEGFWADFESLAQRLGPIFLGDGL
ncbi:MAG: exodeoxyribonuclease V subunit gamma [Deltaproteobacteria bacterium]|nr:exodeoxyribonuclease V subunit gamma [Candidatus Tharpella aukensis]